MQIIAPLKTVKMKKRPILMKLPTNGVDVVYRVTFDGITFQGYFKFRVTRNDTAAYIYHFQTDDVTRLGIKTFLGRVLPSIINYPK